MKIGIMYHDNDFMHTYGWFLKILKDAIVEEQFDINKYNIIKIHDKIIGGIYWLFQNQLKYDLDWNPYSYLKIKETDIFLDKEIYDLLNSNYFCNCEFCYIDTETSELKWN